MKIQKLEQLTHERWLNLFAVDYEHHGHHGRWVFATRHDKPYSDPPGDAVVIVPILRSPGQPPRLVMIREFRVPVGDYVISVPAGLVEKGEPVEEAVRREMEEETGFVVTKVKRVTQALYTSCGMTDEAQFLAFVDVAGDDGVKNKPDGGEDIQVMLLDFEGVCRVCHDASLRVDAKAWLVLQQIEMMGRIE